MNQIDIEKIRDIGEKLSMEPEDLCQVCQAAKDLPGTVEEPSRELTGSQWMDAWKQLTKILGPDEKGLRILACMLWAAVLTEEKYKTAGMPEDIFVETMKCFPRFIHEHKVSYGSFGFDRDFWTGRQLSLNLFRIGTLEYEKLIQQDGNRISIHIPSDAVLTGENCRVSVAQARDFFEKYAPDFCQVPYICQSWLLSPALKALLPKDSHILQFQEMFQILHRDEADTSFMEWVFKKGDIPLKDLPENTTLQRRMKAYLLQGGRVGEAFGVLKQD